MSDETDEFGGIAAAPETDEFGGVAVAEGAPETDEFGGIAATSAKEEPGVIAKLAGTPAKSAYLYNQGIEEGVASMARATKRLTDIGARPDTFAEHERTALRASEMAEAGGPVAEVTTPWMQPRPSPTRLQLDAYGRAAGELNQRFEETRQELMGPAAALEEAATQSGKEFGQMAADTTGYAVPGAEAAGSMTPVLASAMVPGVGGPAAIAMGGLQTGGDVWEQAHDYYLKQGYSDEQATAIADKLGGQAGAANAAVFTALPGFGNRLATAALGERLAERPGLQAAARTALAGGQAGAVMGADAAIRDLQASQTYRPDLTLGQAAREVGESALVGGLVGAGLHGPMEVAKMPPGPDHIGKSFDAARSGELTAAEMEAGAAKEAAEEGAPAAEPEELTQAERLHVDNVQAEVDKVRPGVRVVYEPGKVNQAGFLMDGWYENGELVVNAGEVTSAKQARAIVGEEWGHAKLATPEGQAALTEFINSQHSLSGAQLFDLFVRGYQPAEGESIEAHERRLHDEFIAKHGREQPSWFGDMVDRFSGWAKGRLGINMNQAQAARALLRGLDPRVGTDEGGVRQSLLDHDRRTDEFNPDDELVRTERAPTVDDDHAQVSADYQRYQQLVGQAKGRSLDEAMGTAREIEEIKNRYSGKPPPDPETVRQSLVNEDERRRGAFITVHPVRHDALEQLGGAELKKRIDSLKMTHLRRATADIAEAFGLPIHSEQAVASAAIEGGEREMGVGHRIELGTQDDDLARTVAGLIGASSPQLADGAVVWREHAGGRNFVAEVTPRNRKAAMRMIDDWQARHPKDDFTFDPATGKISTVLGGATEAQVDRSTNEFLRFVERHKNEGNVAKSETPAHRQGSVHFQESRRYGEAISEARAYASSRPEAERQRILDVVDRAQQRLDSYQAGLLTAAKATRELAQRPAPSESAAGIAKSLGKQKFESIRGFARWMDDRFTKRYGKTMSPIGDPAARKRSARALVYDVLDGLSRDGSGKGWYDERVKATMQEIAKLHPELAHDPASQGVFAAILASTSQGYTVGQNFEIAEAIFRRWQRDGRIPTDTKLAKGMGPINKNLGKVQALIDQHGMPWFLEFMDREVTGGYLRDELKMPATGVKLQDSVRGARILGPKIGSFFGNLRGRFDSITMDLWYTRTMHRYIGETRAAISKPAAQNAIKWFDQALRERARAGHDVYGLDPRKDVKTDDDTVEAAAKVFNGWSKDGYQKGKFDNNNLERAARAVKQRVGDMRGAPQNKSARDYFADILRDAQAELKAKGFNLSEADLQAIAWFREKSLFAHAGVASDAAKPADYLDAAMALRDKIEKGEGIWANKDAAALADLSGIKGTTKGDEGGLRGGKDTVVRTSLVDHPALEEVPRTSLVDDLGENFRRTRLSFQSVFSPQNIDSQSKRFANGLRDLNGQQAINLVRSAAKMQELRDFFDRTPVPRDYKYDPTAPLPLNYQVMAALETNRAALPPKLQEFARVLDQEFAHRIAEVQRLQPGAMQQLIQDYFPHMWERPQSSSVGNFMAEVAARTPLAGSKAFMRQRTLPTLMDGLARGLKPISDNPVDIALAKMHQMDKFILSAKLLQEAKATGMLKFFKLGSRIPDGMRIVDDRAGTVFAPPMQGGAGPQLVGHWALPDGAATVLENHLSPGLQRFWAYRTLRAGSNILNAAQLGFSAFHLGFTSMDATTSSLATALTYLLNGKVGPAGKAASIAAVAPALNYYMGKAVQARMVDPSSRGVRVLGMDVPLPRRIDDLVGKVADLAVKGGLRAEQDPFWKTAVTRNLKRALYEGGVKNYAKAGMAAPFALIEQSVRPIAEYLVPRQKLGVFAQLAVQEMEKIGWGAGVEETRAAMARAADTTEDRMGQMTYDNMFYNRTAKDLALLGFRAYGWQLGKYRALYGAAVDTVKAGSALAHGRVPEVTNRMAYPVALTLVAGLAGAVVHRMLTGKNPDSLKDYIFPKSGQTNPDGTPARLMLPTYLKDIAGEVQALRTGGVSGLATSVYHKLNPGLSAVADMWNNKDFYGTEIADPTDPVAKRALDYGTFAAKTFAPFSLSGGMKLWEQGSPAAQLILPFIGITPAKQALLMSPAQTLSADIYRQSFPMAARSRSDAEHAQLLRDIVKELQGHPGGPSPVLAQAQAAGQLRGGDANRLESMMSGQAPLAYQAGKISPRDAMRVWRLATPEERVKLFPIIGERLSRASNMDPELRTRLIQELVRDRPPGM